MTRETILILAGVLAGGIAVLLLEFALIRWWMG